MKRIAIVADSHFDTHSRWEETLRVHQWIVDDIATRDVSLICHAGDVFERKSSAAERNAVASWLMRCASIAPVLIVRGNHDYVEPTGAGDLAIFRELRAKHPILVEEAAGVHELGGIAVGALAWPRKAHVLAQAGGGQEESAQFVQDALRNVLRGMGDRLDALNGPRLLVCHVMIDGARTDHDQPIVGADMAVSLEDLSLARTDFVVCGHVHAQNDWVFGGTPIVYPGSPRSCNFGEAGPKGYVIVELGDGPVLWSRVATPATPMVLIEAAWSVVDAQLSITSKTFPSAARVSGAEVRLRYEVAAEHRDAARRSAHELRDRMVADGAVNVKVEEEVFATMRARAPEIAMATTLADKLAALWRSRQDVPSADRAARLLSKVTEIEVEVAA